MTLRFVVFFALSELGFISRTSLVFDLLNSILAINSHVELTYTLEGAS